MTAGRRRGSGGEPSVRAAIARFAVGGLVALAVLSVAGALVLRNALGGRGGRRRAPPRHPRRARRGGAGASPTRRWRATRPPWPGSTTWCRSASSATTSSASRSGRPTGASPTPTSRASSAAPTRWAPTSARRSRPGVTDAEISDLSKPENVYERDNGSLLEVYLPIRTARRSSGPVRALPAPERDRRERPAHPHGRRAGRHRLAAPALAHPATPRLAHRAAPARRAARARAAARGRARVVVGRAPSRGGRPPRRPGPGPRRSLLRPGGRRGAGARRGPTRRPCRRLRDGADAAREGIRAPARRGGRDQPGPAARRRPGGGRRRTSPPARGRRARRSRWTCPPTSPSPRRPRSCSTARRRGPAQRGGARRTPRRSRCA